MRATLEGTISYARYRVRNGDALKRFAATVFANRFISEICFLNGRKVMTCILKKLKKEKI